MERWNIQLGIGSSLVRWSLSLALSSGALLADLRRCVSLLAIASFLAACAEGTPPQEPPAARKTYNLTVLGYNYTDFGIGSFEVNGQGGGNLMVSSPTSGGGKSLCCVGLYTPVALPKRVRVKWALPQHDDRWCEVEVELQGPIPDKPEYLEVHFYPDGHIEVAVTESRSPPRLRLEAHDYSQRLASGNKVVLSPDAKCKDGY